MSTFRDRVRRRRPPAIAVNRLRGRSASTAAPKPPADTEAAIVGIVARTYPRAGNQLEAAARMAVRLGWAAARATKGEQP